MSEKKTKSATSRTRNYATVVYPESAPENWQQIISESKVPVFISPLHDKDKNATGEDKKPHYHVQTMYDAPKTREQAEEFFQSFGGVGCEVIGSTRAYARYLCHLDNPEKAQYDIGQVKAYGGADYMHTIGTASDIQKAIREMMVYIEENDCTFVDSCASGGGRNDIESMRRGIPFMRSDADRTTSGLRLSMSSTLPYWIPFHGSNNKETKGELDPPSGKGNDFYISRASYLPAAWGIGGQVTQNPELDLKLMKDVMKEWRSLSDLLLKDYYVLTPWHDENDLKGWTAFAYNDPEAGKAAVLAFRQDECEEDSYVLKLPFAKPEATYQIKDEDSGKVWECQGGELVAGIKATLPEKRSSLLWRINIK